MPTPPLMPQPPAYYYLYAIPMPPQGYGEGAMPPPQYNVPQMQGQPVPPQMQQRMRNPEMHQYMPQGYPMGRGQGGPGMMMQGGQPGSGAGMMRGGPQGQGRMMQQAPGNMPVPPMPSQEGDAPAQPPVQQ